MSTYFASVNRSKRSVAVDLKRPEGAAAVRRLAGCADIVMENYRAGALDAYGLGYEAVSAANHGVVYCSLTGFGLTGSGRGRAGYDVAVAAEGGLLSITGDAGGMPAKPGVAVTDMLTGMHAATAALAALAEVRGKGPGAVGRHLDVSLMDCQLATLANVAGAALNRKPGTPPPRRWGSAHQSIVPYQAFLAADGRPLVVAAMSDAQFASLCAALGGPLTGLSDDGLLATNAGRVARRDEVVDAVQRALRVGATAGMTRDETVEVLVGAGLSASPVNDVDEAFASRHAAERGSVVETRHPTAGSVRLPAPAVRAAAAGRSAAEGSDPSAVSVRSPPPLLGEHTAEALTEWGCITESELGAGLRDGWLVQAE